MKKLSLILFSILITSFTFAQNVTKTEVLAKAEAQEVVTVKQVAAFDKTKFVGKVSVKMVKSNVNSIEIHLFNISSNKLTWGVKDSLLSIKLGSGSEESYAEVVLNYTDVNVIDVNGAEVTLEDADFKTLDFNITGGGSVSYKGSVKDLTINMSGNSHGLFVGDATYLTVNATGGSQLNTQTMKSHSAIVKATSLAEVMVSTTQRLVAEASTKAKIFYLGVPELLKQSTWSMGSVSEINASNKK